MKKVLIIEDEPTLIEMYRDRLSHAGFKVFTAIEAEEGIDITIKKLPDLIILDMLLPRKNGIAFLRDQKKHSEISEIPVVILSNFDSQETREDASKLGAKDYLLKTDYTPTELIDKIKKYFK